MKKLFLIIALCFIAFVAVGNVPVFADQEVTINHNDHGSTEPLKAYINQPQVTLLGAYDAPYLVGLKNNIPILSWLLDDHYLGFEGGKGFMTDPFWDSRRDWIEDDKGYYIVTKVTNTKCYFNCPEK